MHASTLEGGFWDDPKEAEKTLKKISAIKFWTDGYAASESKLADLQVLMEFGEDAASDVQAAYDDLEHYLRNIGFAGVKMQPLFDAFTADSPAVDPIMEIARKYAKPVFIHCGHPPFSLPWQIGLLAERHPDVPIVMVHMGHGHGVYIEGSINMAKKYGNLFLEVSGMPMGCQIKNAYETVGSERVMFGIDSPFHHPSVEIQRVLSCGLNDSQLEDVFYNNARKFMGL